MGTRKLRGWSHRKYVVVINTDSFSRKHDTSATADYAVSACHVVCGHKAEYSRFEMRNLKQIWPVFKGSVWFGNLYLAGSCRDFEFTAATVRAMKSSLLTCTRIRCSRRLCYLSLTQYVTKVEGGELFYAINRWYQKTTMKCAIHADWMNERSHFRRSSLFLV